MSEVGYLVEAVERVLGPVRRRVVREEWYATGGVILTAVVPRYSHLTLRGQTGERTLCKLEGVPSNVDVDRRRW